LTIKLITLLTFSRETEPDYSWPCAASETRRSVPFPMMMWSWSRRSKRSAPSAS